jgi:hypothetical protein
MATEQVTVTDIDWRRNINESWRTAGEVLFKD